MIIELKSARDEQRLVQQVVGGALLPRQGISVVTVHEQAKDYAFYMTSKVPRWHRLHRRQVVGWQWDVTKPILLFADRLPPLTGGMEMHARYFIEYFTGHARYPLEAVITRDPRDRDARVISGGLGLVELANLSLDFSPAIVFFNSGRWIEDMRALRAKFPDALFVYRTGGNEILKAPLERVELASHAARQQFWSETLNDTVDVLVTNSEFTETRLRAIGVSCRFLRCVGGVALEAIRSASPAHHQVPVLFCAARFVPYKNHATLIDVIHEVSRRGVEVRLRLAGDGPLLDKVRRQVEACGLTERVAFLGALDNHEVCREIVAADVYVQLSGDVVTPVPGGSYVHSEGMGRSILEAISAGRHVFAGRSGALSEIVTPDRGTLVPLGDTRVIADALESLLRAPLPRPQPVDLYDWSSVFGTLIRAWESGDARPHRH